MKISLLVRKENNNLDLVRIILASLVIIGHAPYLNGPSAYWRDPIGHFFAFTYSGAFAVKLFFFISGLVVTNSFLNKRNILYFAISRIFRLMPALFLVLVITVFLIGPLATTLSPDNYFSQLHYFSYIRNNLIFRTEFYLPGLFHTNFFADGVNGSLWSLKYEVCCYIVLLGLFILLGFRNKLYLNIPVILIIVDSFLPSGIIVKFLGTNSEHNLLPALFAFGVWFAINREVFKINLGLVLISFLAFSVFRNTSASHLIFMFSSCIAALYFSGRKAVLKLKPKYDISYGIYLWGFLIQQTVYYYFGHMYVGLHCLIVLVIVFCLALFSAVFIEKPFIHLGKLTYKFFTSRIGLSKINF